LKEADFDESVSISSKTLTGFCRYVYRYHHLLYYHYHYGLYHRHRRARHAASKQSNPQLAHFSLQDQKKKKVQRHFDGK
jgi:hypothetical protein